jgi:FixJ family two-component response regulator
MTAVPPVVFVVDDDPSVRRSLTNLIESAGYAVEGFASAREFLERDWYAGPCCLVLDVRMPGLGGLDLQEALAGAGHRMSIVFVTGHGDISMSVRAMKGGAVDFLTKPFDETELLTAIERAVAKDVHKLDDEARVTEVQKRVKTLTPREVEVFALVVTARVMEKMRAKSVAELVRLADRLGVIVPKS